ncbi:MAG TPA: hypothetical protein VGG11_21915 [Xanthobacteraceae bacterium]|jgi:hypothetical protein
MDNVKNEKAENAAETGKPTAEIVPLHLRYRKIGISAVAAAARYQGSGKNHAHAPGIGPDHDPAAA